MKKKNNRARVILLLLFLPIMLLMLLLAACSCSRSYTENVARSRMLATVKIHDIPDIHILYRSSEQYEILQVGINRDSDLSIRDIIPESWQMESIAVVELCERLHISIDIDAIWEDSMGGDQCDAWYFVHNDDGDFYLGYYEEYQHIIHIYHGKNATVP